MELSVRDWMLIIGLLLIVAVLFDGFRRMRNDRRGNIRVSLNKNFVDSGDVEEVDDAFYSTELPGSARVVPRDQQATSKAQRADPFTTESTDLQLDESVPMLMESVSVEADTDELSSESFSAVTKPSLEEEATALAKEEAVANEHELDDVHCHSEGSNNADTVLTPAEENTEEQLIDPLFDKPSPRSYGRDFEQQELPNLDNTPKALDSHSKAKQPSDDIDKEVIVVNVMAKEGAFKGRDLLHILLACDCRYGEMNIFHRYEDASGRGAVQFSIVNSVEPGVFQLDDIDNFTTPGICFFITLPGPKKPIQAFDYMVETAQCLVKNLNGELRDETRSVMTSQTLEHCRQRIREMERKQLMRS